MKISDEKFAIRVLDFFKLKHNNILTDDLLTTLARKLSIVKDKKSRKVLLRDIREAFTTYKIVNRKTLQKRPVDIHKGDISTPFAPFADGKVFKQPTITQPVVAPPSIIQKPIQLQGTVNNPLDQFLQDLDKFTTPSQARVIRQRIERQEQKAREIIERHGGGAAVPRKPRAKKPVVEESESEEIPDDGAKPRKPHTTLQERGLMGGVPHSEPEPEPLSNPVEKHELVQET